MSSSQKKTKHCPRLRKPCIEDRCTDWIGYPAERFNELTGGKVIETVYMCNYIWATKIAFDAARFADQAGASLDSLRNHVAEGNASLGSLIYTSRKRLKGGNHEDETRQEIEGQHARPHVALDAPPNGEDEVGPEH